MQATRRKRLYIILWVVCFLSLGLGAMLYALRDNINVYVTPSELASISDKTHSVQLGGMVKKGSLKRLAGVTVQFKVTDYQTDVAVDYDGVLPALFREGQGVIMLGKLDQFERFQAKTILAKHDENYHPPNIPRNKAEQGNH